MPFPSLASDSPGVELGPECAGTPQTPFHGEHGEVSFLHHAGLLTFPCSSRDSGSFRSSSAQRMGRHLSKVEGLMVLGAQSSPGLWVSVRPLPGAPCLGFSPGAALVPFSCSDEPINILTIPVPFSPCRGGASSLCLQNKHAADPRWFWLPP